MLYSVIMDIILAVAGAGLSLLVLDAPYSYIVTVLCILEVFVKSMWLRELIEELREAVPQKKSRKKNNTGQKRMAITIVLMEIVAGLALFILHTNGVKISPEIGLVTVLIAMLIGIILS